MSIGTIVTFTTLFLIGIAAGTATINTPQESRDTIHPTPVPYNQLQTKAEDAVQGAHITIVDHQPSIQLHDSLLDEETHGTISQAVTTTSDTASDHVSTTFDALIYPGSNLISSSSTTTTLESNDDSNQVTDWYKAQFPDSTWDVRSVVTARANDNVESQLVVSHQGSTLSITITQKQPEDPVRIVIDKHS